MRPMSILVGIAVSTALFAAPFGEKIIVDSVSQSIPVSQNGEKPKKAKGADEAIKPPKICLTRPYTASEIVCGFARKEKRKCYVNADYNMPIAPFVCYKDIDGIAEDLRGEISIVIAPHYVLIEEWK